MSRWSNWSSGTEERKLGFGAFIKESPPDIGNPSAAMGPAERAKALGLQSNGRGGYIDPQTGQVVARTVNNELIFYDNNSATGGAIADSSGGAQLTQSQPSWADPLTGMLTTPPSKAESPSEIAAIPDAIPATPPAGYNSFMQKKKQAAYQQNQVDPQPARVTPDEAEQQDQMDQGGDPGEMPAFAAEDKKTFDMFIEADAAQRMADGFEKNKEKIAQGMADAAKKRSEIRQKGPIGTLPAEMSAVVNPTTSLRKDQLVSAGRAQAGTAPQPAQTDNVQTAAQPTAVGQPQKPQTHNASEILQQRHQENLMDGNKSISEKLRTMDEIRSDWAPNLDRAVRVSTQNDEEATKEIGKLTKAFDAVIDDESIPEEQKRGLIELSSRFLGSYKGRRRDVLLNEFNEPMIQGLLSNIDKLEEVFAEDENGFPNAEKIKQFKEEDIVHNYDIDTLKRFWKSIPKTMRSNFGGGDVKAFDGFVDYMRTDGKDLLTNQYLDPEVLNQDHLIAASQGKSAMPDEVRSFIETDMNHLPQHKAINQTMLGKTKLEFFKYMREQFGNPENRVEGLQDFIYGLNETKYDLKAMPLEVLSGLLTDTMEDGRRVFKTGLGEDAIESALQMVQERYESVLGPLEQSIKGYDPEETLLGPSTSRNMSEQDKSKRSQLRQALSIIENMREGANTNDIFSILGQPRGGDSGLARSFYADSIRGSNFAGKAGVAAFEAIKKDLLENLRENGTPEGQSELQDLWANTTSSANNQNRNVWNSQHATSKKFPNGNPRGALRNGVTDKQEVSSFERGIRDDNERRWMSAVDGAGLIRRDKLPPEVIETIESILSRSTLYEQNENLDPKSDTQEEEPQDTNQSNFIELLNVMLSIQQMMGSQGGKGKKSLEDFKSQG